MHDCLIVQKVRTQGGKDITTTIRVSRFSAVLKMILYQVVDGKNTIGQFSSNCFLVFPYELR